ncbi:hypothetical protein I3760_09G069400 [Carya illinoinensis]|nr:hypothetical protein I3760_09G069400 [Carya illinoinensis]
MAALKHCHLYDLPDVILTIIFSLVIDTRTRNAMSLVSLKWYLLERSTRTYLTLRGNIRDLIFLPTCFQAVTNLDLSFLSPWGHPLLDESFPNPTLLAQLFGQAFPNLISFTAYARYPITLNHLAPQWPNLRHAKLIRWHQRLPTAPLGSDFLPLLEHCHSLSSLDLSHFYCWTEDLPLALKAYPNTAASLSYLSILTHSSTEGYKAHELLAITAACPNLRQFLATCIFDHRFIGSSRDETLLSLASNCPHLSLLHLVDITSFSNAWAVNPDDEGYTYHDAIVSHATLVDLCAGLPLLEDLVLDVCHNVKDTRPALKLLNSKCPRLKSLTLGQFHWVCRGIFSRPDVIPLCSGLESLSIKNAADLTDRCLIAISHGCPRLAQFEVTGCKMITETGIRNLASNLRRTLIDVKISCCKHLNAVCTLRALDPIRGLIQRLHIDCVWKSVQRLEEEQPSALERVAMWKDTSSFNKECKKHSSLNLYHILSHGSGSGNSIGDIFPARTWAKLQSLSLWISVGEMLTPLTLVGLEDCPVLEEIQIRIEGDCRQQIRPSMHAFGLSSLECYPRLSKMNLDCGGAVGYALTAPAGYPDLNMWERFYLSGIGSLKLTELNYWPPQDTELNKRTLSLPGAGLLAQCPTLRKLFIHGAAAEHLMMFLLKVPTLRDVQLREDYYPAPENYTSLEMRVRWCCRFEDALNRRQIPD